MKLAVTETCPRCAAGCGRGREAPPSPCPGLGIVSTATTRIHPGFLLEWGMCSYVLCEDPQPSLWAPGCTDNGSLCLRSQFNALKVPVPEDKYSALVDAEEKEDVKSCAEFLSLSKTRIEQYEKELEKMRNIIPFDQMTIEDLNEVFPETKLDKKKYPYWPHKPIENL
ncbi:ATP synthase peripheral stalk subunit d [Phyllostomus discolor]|uniref:ATP synthase peripheral stalk subunit d n=1 Tax=Phyllostomus discolor TaxID=89673 RepID=A0A834DU34_9CHIR|nr:ATP synthase peripheral stalk subunit d [Phyllostomus discolor]